MTKQRIIKIVICIVVLLALIGTGVGMYFYYHRGEVVGRIQYGKYYYLAEIHPTERFKGATMNSSSYFRIKNDKQTGELYLVGLEASTTPIPLIITKYKEGVKHTVIEFEYILKTGENGADTRVQRLTAISTNDCITIKAEESYKVSIVHQKHNDNDPNTLTYESTIMVFNIPKEVA